MPSLDLSIGLIDERNPLITEARDIILITRDATLRTFTGNLNQKRLAPLADLTISFDLFGTIAGRAWTHKRDRATGRLHPHISLNPPLLIREGRRFIARTPLHELAHIVADLYHNDYCHHDRRWVRTFRALHEIAIAEGLPVEPDFSRCHDFDTSHLRRTCADLRASRTQR